MSCSGMPIPSQAGAETAVISSAVVLAAEGVEARRQTRQVLKFSNCREGMVQTTNLKRAAKAEVGSIIPWLQVRILPVPVTLKEGILRSTPRERPLFFGSTRTPLGGQSSCIEPACRDFPAACGASPKRVRGTKVVVWALARARTSRHP